MCPHQAHWLAGGAGARAQGESRFIARSSCAFLPSAVVGRRRGSILTGGQGKDAAGGAYDYLVGDKLIGGFAVVAWPASYRNSGVTTFIVNHDGVVYEKDLGGQTASIAQAMTRYNPDATWRKAQ